MCNFQNPRIKPYRVSLGVLFFDFLTSWVTYLIIFDLIIFESFFVDVMILEPFYFSVIGAWFSMRRGWTASFFSLRSFELFFLCAWKFMLAQKTSSRSPLALEAMSGGWFRRSDRFGAGVDGLCRKSPFVGKYQRTSRHWRLFLPKTLEDIWILTQQGLVMIEFENECTTGRLTCPSVNFNIFQPYSWTPRPYSWHVNDGKCCCSVSPPLSPQNHEWFCGKSMIELDPCVCALCLDLIVR